MDPSVDAILRAALALLFAAAVRHKLGDLPALRAAIAGYRLVPRGLEGLASALVIGGEASVVLLLATPGRRDAGLYAAAALLAGYAAAMGVNLARGRRDLDCGCGGPGQPISGWLVGRNLVLAAVALGATSPIAERPLMWIDACTVVGALAALAALWGAAGHLVANLPAVARARGLA